MTEEERENSEAKALKVDDALSFKPVGRPIALSGVADEFRVMSRHLNKPLTAEIAARVCEKSGSHLLKLVSARAKSEEACLYIEPVGSNQRPKLLPSTDAKDIPYSKVLYRPLEILDHPTRSLDHPPRSIVDDVMNPDGTSEIVLDAFAEVFGQDVLDAVKEALLRPKQVTKLAAGEFPIIFVPQPDGADLQITPVSPASAFMGVKTAIGKFYIQKANIGVEPRMSFLNQSVSAKPQNISGAIGGPRKRIVASMPPIMNGLAAELYRYVHGRSFPRWRDPDVKVWVLRYADMLDKDSRYNNKDTRAALDRTADRLIRDAQAFVRETHEEAMRLATEMGIDRTELSVPPEPNHVLLRRKWAKEGFDKARRALNSSHFLHRLTHSSKLTKEETQPV